MKDPNYQNIYCLVHAEQLPYQVCEAAFKEYETLSQGNNGKYCISTCIVEEDPDC